MQLEVNWEESHKQLDKLLQDASLTHNKLHLVIYDLRRRKTSEDWKVDYKELDDKTQKAKELNHQLSVTLHAIETHINTSDRLALRQEYKNRLLKLKEDVTLQVEYNDQYRDNRQLSFEAGTLIDAKILGPFAHVYLNDESDGHVYFPADKLEEVILHDDEVDWDNVVCQG